MSQQQLVSSEALKAVLESLRSDQQRQDVALADARRVAVAMGACSTPAATAEKAVRLEDTSWTLEKGRIVCVLCQYTNSASNPTLNVNGTGAKPLYYGESRLTTSNLNRAGYAGRFMTYLYTGEYWLFVSWGSDTAYNVATADELSDYDGAVNRVIQARHLNRWLDGRLSEYVTAPDLSDVRSGLLEDISTRSFPPIACEMVELEISRERFIRLTNAEYYMDEGYVPCLFRWVRRRRGKAGWLRYNVVAGGQRGDALPVITLQRDSRSYRVAFRDCENVDDAAMVSSTKAKNLIRYKWSERWGWYVPWGNNNKVLSKRRSVRFCFAIAFLSRMPDLVEDVYKAGLLRSNLAPFHVYFNGAVNTEFNDSVPEDLFRFGL